MRAILALLIVLTSTGCATGGGVTQKQGVQAAVAVHAVIAAIDDTEMTLAKSGLLTTAEHTRANPLIVKALQAGKAFDGAVRAWPNDKGAAKLHLNEVTDALAELGTLLAEFASPDAKERIRAGLLAAQTAILTAVALLL